MTIETGWLIEAQDHSSGHQWLRIIKDSSTRIDWTPYAEAALRFSRKEDAVLFAWLHKEHCTLALVTEHSFGVAK